MHEVDRAILSGAVWTTSPATVREATQGTAELDGPLKQLKRSLSLSQYWSVQKMRSLKITLSRILLRWWNCGPAGSACGSTCPLFAHRVRALVDCCCCCCCRGRMQQLDDGAAPLKRAQMWAASVRRAWLTRPMGRIEKEKEEKRDDVEACRQQRWSSGQTEPDWLLASQLT